MNINPRKTTKLNKILNINKFPPRNIYQFLVSITFFCGPNDWIGIVNEQIPIIRRSDLFKNISKLYITIIGTHTDI